MKTETYDIQGMSCAACSSAVERVTRKLLGVDELHMYDLYVPISRLQKW